MKIGIIGWNGAKNVGDDSMTYTLITSLVRIFSKIEFWIIGIQGRKSMGFLKDFSPNHSFKILAFNFRFGIINKLRSFLYIYFFPLLLVLRCDFIFIGGGSIFHGSKTNLQYLNLIWFKNILGKKKLKIILIGVSVGPFLDELAEARFIKLLNQVECVIVRDSRSFEFCISNSENIDIQLFPDLALFYPYQRKKINISKNNVVIVIRQGFLTTSIEKLIVNTCQRIISKDPKCKIIFLSACSIEDKNENDIYDIKQIVQKIDSQVLRNIQVIQYTGVPDDFYELVENSLFTISMRLHGMIISNAVGVNSFLISYHKKCKDIFQELKLSAFFDISEDIEKGDGRILEYFCNQDKNDNDIKSDYSINDVVHLLKTKISNFS